MEFDVTLTIAKAAKLPQTIGVQVSDAELTNVLGRISSGAVPGDLETETLDFKSQPDSKPDAIRALVESAICFANSSGGTVVMGVADKTAGSEAFLGCDLDAKIVQRRINELTEPPLMVGARQREYMGTTLLVVDVFQSFDIHADKQGRASHRVGTKCNPLSTSEHRRLREARLPVDWSAQPSERSIADLNPAAMVMARESLRRVPDEREQLATLSDIDLLRALGVVNENDQLLRAGELLFCNPTSKGSGLVYQYRLTPGGEASAVERIDLPMMLGFERTMELIWARRNVTPVTLPNGQQIDIADFPEIAVREALSNALIHRDYRITQPVNIEHSPSAFIAWSPGPLVGSVTSANILTHASTPRNPILAAAARVLRLAEQTGRGVDRMYREMIRAGQDLPIIEEGLDFVRLVLGRGAPRTSIAKFVAQLPSEEREDTDLMLVLYALCQRRTVTAETLSPLLQKSDGETELVLRRLSQEALGIIERTRETRRARAKTYRLRGDAIRALGVAVRYNRRTVDEVDRKVVAHIAEYGKVTNRTLQNLFDIDLWRARDILADLQNRQIIVRTSEAARGPAVEYGKGSKFPRSRSRNSNPSRVAKPDGVVDDDDSKLF